MDTFSDLFTRTVSSLCMLFITISAVYSGGYLYNFVLFIVSFIAYIEWYLMSCCEHLLQYQSIGFIIIAFFQHSILLFKNNTSALIKLLAIVWTSDSSAYIFGSYIGGRKFSLFSPNKTYSGLFAGIICGTLVGVILDTEIYKGIIISSFCQLGDYTESICKRVANIKDSNIPGLSIPGHGGILDRCDGLILATPIAYVLLYK